MSLKPLTPATAESNTIERLDGRTVYANPFVSLDTDAVRFPDGALGSYTTITVGAGVGVIAVPTVEQDGQRHWGLVRQYRYPTGEYSLEFPRGSSKDLSANEAARELVEETGLSVGTATRLGEVRPDTGILTTRVAVWHTPMTTDSLSHEHEEAATGARLQWATDTQMRELVRHGQITCGMTLAAYALALVGA